MNKINKGKEPQAWLALRKTPGAVFTAIPELRAALLEEQGHLCAYCMRRIPASDGTCEQMRVEHIKPRHYKDTVLAYRNLLACCPGAISGTRPADIHCDRRKGDREISFDIFSDAFVDTLSYASKTGEITSSNEQYDQEINHVLGLNNARLAQNRLQVLEGVVARLGAAGTWNRAAVQHLLQDWESPHIRAGRREFKEYNGIVVWFLKRWLKRNTSRV